MYDGLIVAEYCHVMSDDFYESGTSQNINLCEVLFNETCRFSLFCIFCYLQHTDYTSWLITSFLPSPSAGFFLTCACRNFLTAFQADFLGPSWCRLVFFLSHCWQKFDEYCFSVPLRFFLWENFTEWSLVGWSLEITVARGHNQQFTYQETWSKVGLFTLWAIAAYVEMSNPVHFLLT